MASASAVGVRSKGAASGRKQIAVGYLRRSTDRQQQSIPDQQKAIEGYAEEQGFRIQRFYTDDAISGTSTAGRRAFQSLIADAKRKSRSFRFVIVYDVKRFGRVDNDEAGYYRHVLRQNGVEVLYVSENFNGDGTDDLIRPGQTVAGTTGIQGSVQSHNPRIAHEIRDGYVDGWRASIWVRPAVRELLRRVPHARAVHA